MVISFQVRNKLPNIQHALIPDICNILLGKFTHVQGQRNFFGDFATVCIWDNAANALLVKQLFRQCAAT